MMTMTTEQYAEAIRNLPKFRKFEALSNGVEKNKVRCTRDRDDDTVFIYCKGKKRYGYRYSMTSFLMNYTPVILSKDEETKKWQKKLATIEKRLEASGLWENIKIVAHNLQSMTKEEFDRLYLNQDRYGQNEDISDLYIKYPFLKDGDKINYEYTADWTRSLKTKSMNFGWKHKDVSEQIKRHLSEQTSFSERGYTSYDVSYQYDADKKRAWYSEEYRGCGNGHYYLALDGTMALHYEDD